MRKLIAILVSFLCAAACVRDVGDGAEAALRTLDRAYVDAWKNGDPDEQKRAVIELLADDAIVMPGGGLEPRRGRDAIREFWFPEGAPPTKIIEFVRKIDGVEARGDLGIVHGRFTLEFEYDGQRTRQAGNYMMIARRTSNNAWRISHSIWNAERFEQ